MTREDYRIRIPVALGRFGFPYARCVAPVQCESTRCVSLRVTTSANEGRRNNVQVDNVLLCSPTDARICFYIVLRGVETHRDIGIGEVPTFCGGNYVIIFEEKRINQDLRSFNVYIAYNGHSIC